ncbi:disease resistance protein RGA2 [Vitis vinifera]|uniref:disease resistance protein RGA2 n=1 Tax=Vitis vinifera TaxID=29760 RepID=UPI002882FE8E|nr:disease resistance protein RGA2 [Vitis vinifera]
MGGVGKTTLAQLAYHDDRVKNHFDLRAWVCVSDDFDVLRIAKTLLQSIASYAREINDLNLLQVKLKEKLSGKKFLLVLDDVWNENYDKWDRLCTPLRAGGPGSKVIITTRMGVASLTRKVSPYPLQELSNDDCRAVFAHALGARNFEAHPHVKIIGEEMVNRCRGLPLVAKALGGILRNELNHEAWDDILKSKIWDLPEEKSGVLPALKLSYHHLPSHLKQCFAYCAIFPKGYEFKKDELILLWMGEGFLQQTKGKKRMEDLGSKYFSELLSRSFFQQSSDIMPRFMMHDLIHDLAQSIAGNVCFNLEDKLENNENIFQKARHLSFIRQANEIFKKFEVVDKGKYLRTFLALPISVSFMKKLPQTGVISRDGLAIDAEKSRAAEMQDSESWRSENVHPSTLKRLEIWDCGQFQPISEQMLHSNTALEQLSISNYPNMKILPGFLHSLTYLYIYGCQGLVSFPERGLPTPNLRDLYINNCENLKSLSHQMQNLSSLQGLNIRNCQGLESFPECGLAPNLTSLSIRDCVTLKVPLSEWGLHRLTSLSSLYISGVCPSLASLSDDDCLLPTTLSKLFISKLDSLACLALKNLSSLERISIYRSRKPIDESFVVCAVFFPPTRYEEKNDERVQCLLGLIRLVSAIVHKHEYAAAFSSALTQQFD